MTAHVLSVNVGLPRDVVWQGRTVRTAVWKQTVRGRRMVRRLNVDGDGQGDLAGHGGAHRAVFVYQAGSYEHWQKALGRTDLAFGAFGENFTVSGLADDEVCIGDRYRIGTALLEVSQPRVTCYRVGIRLDEPRMAALLVAHNRPGFYFRVLEEGEVAAGDEIVRIRQGPERMSVAAIDALLYKPGHPRDQLARALRIPALSDGWQSSLRSLLDQPDSSRAAGGNPGLAPSAGAPPAWAGFRPLRVAAKTCETVDVTSLVLESTDGGALAAALPGQFVTLRLRPAPDAGPLLRSYSLSGAPGSRTYRVSARRNPAGQAGRHIRDHVQVGDILEVGAPRGHFTLQPGDTPVVLVSAGIGATPLLAMLHALAAVRSPRVIWWVHGARDGAHAAFTAEVQACRDNLPRAHRHVCFSRPSSHDRPCVDFDASGHVGLSFLLALDGSLQDADFYLCGPPPFLSELTTGLAASGIASGRLHAEAFGTGPAFTPGIVTASPVAPHAPRGPARGGPLVSFARSAVEAHPEAASQTILELAEACDVPVRWSCRAGVCHSCETALIAGRVTYRTEPVEPPAEGNVLICCAAPEGDIIIDL